MIDLSQTLDDPLDGLFPVGVLVVISSLRKSATKWGC